MLNCRGDSALKRVIGDPTRVIKINPANLKRIRRYILGGMHIKKEPNYGFHEQNEPILATMERKSIHLMYSCGMSIASLR